MTPFGTKEVLEWNVSNQALTFEAPQGRPTGDGTVTINDPRVDPASSPNPIKQGTATRSSVDTTLSSAAGASQDDPTQFNLASATGVAVGGYVIITNAGGQSERVEVASINSSTKVAHSTYPLAFDYASGATVQSAVMTSPVIPDAWIQNKANIITDVVCIWQYAVAGVTYRVRTTFDVSRASIHYEASMGRVYDRYPGLKKFTFPDHPEGHTQIWRAATEEVVNSLRMDGIEPQRLRGGYDLQLWLIAIKTANLMARNGVTPNKRDIERFVVETTDDYDTFYGKFTVAKIPVPYDGNEDDVITDGETAAMTISLDK